MNSIFIFINAFLAISILVVWSAYPGAEVLVGVLSITVLDILRLLTMLFFEIAINLVFFLFILIPHLLRLYDP